MNGARWYVVQTQPQKERLANFHLENQDFRTFLPLQSRPAGRSPRSRMALRPFFPNYLFVSLDLKRQRWRSVNGTIGVTRLVCFGRDGTALPSALPEGFVEHLREASTPGGEIRFSEEFQTGDHVRIVGGPFNALCGVLEAAKGAERAIILLDILSGATRVEVGRGRLTAA